jgi:ribosomal protein S18 acetylase RimI-like enzyme
MKHDLLKFLRNIEEELRDTLSNLNLETYVNKLIENAAISICHEHGEICGLIAYYCNDRVTLSAYVTFLAVSKEARGRGLGKRLMMLMLDDLKQKKFVSVSLEVEQINKTAIRMYEKLGFNIQIVKQFSYIMSRTI